MIKAMMLAAMLAMSSLHGAIPALADDAPAATVGTVNINDADAETLAERLVGIGPARAEEIVRYREAYGPFHSVEDLLEVRGVGKSILNNNRERISLE